MDIVVGATVGQRLEIIDDTSGGIADDEGDSRHGFLEGDIVRREGEGLNLIVEDLDILQLDLVFLTAGRTEGES